MKKLITLFTVLLLMGCDKSPNYIQEFRGPTNHPVDKRVAENKNQLVNYRELYSWEKFNIIIIDSCEYIQIDGYRKYGISHRGRCSFCEERRFDNIQE
jgi:hypothetical protein